MLSGQREDRTTQAVLTTVLIHLVADSDILSDSYRLVGLERVRREFFAGLGIAVCNTNDVLKPQGSPKSGQ